MKRTCGICLLFRPVFAYFILLLFFRVLRDQWVIAKYQRKEFCAGAERPPYMSGNSRISKWWPTSESDAANRPSSKMA